MSIESNVFLLLNLSELATRYRLYEIRGLKRHAEYYQNQQNLIHRLSYLLKHPVTVIEHDDKPYLVVSDDAAEPPERFQIIRGIVYFKSTGKTLTLDYSLRTPQNDKICWRFLHFMVQSSLFGNAQLWQSSAGKPFFEKVPHQKFGAISMFREIKFGKITLKVACIPEQVSQKIFTLPDYRFGNNHRLSVRGTKGTMQVTLDQVGRKRLELLSSQKAGMYVQEPFDRQYLLLPQTVGDSFGSEFVQDLTKTVDQLYPAGGGYKPQIIYYPDRGFRTYIEQGRAILQTVEDHRLQPGYGIVMLNYTPTFARQHDPLAALVVRKLKEYDLYVATIHSATGKDCYELKYNKHGQPFYAMRSQKRGKLLGYLRAVGLNKILLTNERWPFVLDTPLHADVTIGIDVKHHTAGYIVVNKYGSRIWTLPPVTSKQQEQLSKEQITTCLIEILTREVEQVTYSLLNIVIHRDGRVYDCEIEGAKQAITVLKAQGVLSQDVTLTILEISKSAPASLRLFDVVSKEGQNINNINIGFYRIINNDGYLCSTGQPFSKQGTVKPLHVKYIEGTLSFELCLEDIHYLTALTWTKPDDCSRYPITTKLNDRRLSEDASEYDEDALKFDFLEDIESEVMSDENADNEQSREEIIS